MQWKNRNRCHELQLLAALAHSQASLLLWSLPASALENQFLLKCISVGESTRESGQQHHFRSSIILQNTDIDLAMIYLIRIDVKQMFVDREKVKSDTLGLLFTASNAAPMWMIVGLFHIRNLDTSQLV